VYRFIHRLRGALGESDFLIIYKCLFNGMCLVWSWVRIDALHCGGGAISFLYFVDGMLRSISCRRWNPGERKKTSVASALRHLLKVWVAADLLRGRVPLHIPGSFSSGLDCPMATSLAFISVRLFPSTPLCLGAHHIAGSIFQCLFLTIVDRIDVIYALSFTGIAFLRSGNLCWWDGFGHRDKC